MGLGNFFSRIFTWWNGETIGTQIFTWRKGIKEGEFYEEPLGGDCNYPDW